ncbi:MAG: hypothetical protein IPJ19_03530 [Planctomycetes bacterium]|nr:hypothetical protein [Planctomycetota bacterium]
MDRSMLGLVLALLGPHAAFVAERLPTRGPDLRGTQIVLVECSKGGVIARIPRRFASFGYDWNRGTFRAVESRVVFAHGARELERCAVDLDDARFRELVRGVRDLGLPTLPLEQPAESEDIYRRDTIVHFVHAGRVWQNQLPGGCDQPGSRVQADDSQRAVFDAVIALLDRTLAEGPRQSASELDRLLLHDWKAGELRAFASAVDDLRRYEDVREQLNLNAACLTPLGEGGCCVAFPYRCDQPVHVSGCDRLPPRAAWNYRVELGERETISVSSKPRLQGPRPSLAQRTAFLAAHPELTEAQRELIREGWIGSGFSEALIRAAWGEPLQRSVSGTSVELSYDRDGLHQGPVLVPLRLYDDCLSLDE